MSKVSREDIGLLWNDMQLRCWEELEVLLESHAENIDEGERKDLLIAADELRDEPFPDSEFALFAVLNREVFSSPQKIWIHDF